MDIITLSDHHRQVFGTSPTIISHAPARVNLIGEHVDYQDGFVFPISIAEIGTTFVSSTSEKPVIDLYSQNYRERFSFDPNDLPPSGSVPRWASYLVASFAVTADRFDRLRSHGFSATFSGNIPMGGGLSSSASLEVSFIRLLDRIYDLALDAQTIALLGRKAEHSAWVGVDCGIMDQMVIAASEKDSGLLIDCRQHADGRFDLASISLPADLAIIVADTGKIRELVDSEYNIRKEQVERAIVEYNRITGKTASTARDISSDALAEVASQFSHPSYIKRLRHCVTEIERVVAFVALLRSSPEGDILSRLGALADASHESLDRDFEVTCDELNLMVTIARKQPGVVGARMTGAGFGGATVVFAHKEAARDIIDELKHIYEAASGHRSNIFIATPDAGARAGKL